MENSNNIVRLCGIMGERPSFSHASRGENYYQFPLEIERLSGVWDSIPVVIRESMLRSLETEAAPGIFVAGELRSFNNKSGTGNRLILTVFAKEIACSYDGDQNSIELCGTICKPPNFRRTPMGREICDLMLAVGRPYGRSDYLPCITWGRLAVFSGELAVGTVLRLRGRIQSRRYLKTGEEGVTEKTAFEVSVAELEIVQQEMPKSEE